MGKESQDRNRIDILNMETPELQSTETMKNTVDGISSQIKVLNLVQEKYTSRNNKHSLRDPRWSGGICQHVQWEC